MVTLILGLIIGFVIGWQVGDFNATTNCPDCNEGEKK